MKYVVTDGVIVREGETDDEAFARHRKMVEHNANGGFRTMDPMSGTDIALRATEKPKARRSASGNTLAAGKPPKARKSPHKRKKSSRKSLIARLDRICAKYAKVRARWRCERCGKQYAEGDGRLQWSHHFSRRHHGIRWDADNFSAHCGGCHLFLGGNPQIFAEWIEKKLGKTKHNWLMAKKSKPTKWTDSDLLFMIRQYEDLIREAADA